MGVRNSDALRDGAGDGAARGGRVLDPARTEHADLPRAEGDSRAARLGRTRRHAAPHRRVAGARRGAERRRPRRSGAGALQRDPDRAGGAVDALQQQRPRRDQGVRARAAPARGRSTGCRAACCELAAQAARQAGDETATAADGARGGITLDAPSYVPFMQHSRRRDLREQLYRAFVTRACSGELDNRRSLERILACGARRRAARLRDLRRAEPGAARWRRASAAVERLLDELREAASDARAARARRAPRAARARTGACRGGALCAAGTSPSGPSGCARSATPTATRSCAPISRCPRCSTACSRSPERLFGVRVRAADGEAPVWHPDVRFFRVADEHGAAIAAFYLDPYSRPAEKRGGAWMDELPRPQARARRCACRSPTWSATRRRRSATRPSLMTFREVETLFHEFGHGLQHMLTTVDSRRRRRHQQRRVGRRRAAEPVHGELVLPPPDAARPERATTRPASRCPTTLFEKIVAARTLPRRTRTCCGSCYFAHDRSGAAPRFAPTARRVGLRRAAARRRATTRCCRRCPRIASSAASRTSSPAATRPATTATSGPRC